MSWDQHMPRGATWHARWLLPLVLVVGLLLVPWSSEAPPVMDPVKVTKAIAQWQAWTSKRMEMSQQQKKTPLDTGSSGAVQVLIVPAAAAASRAASKP
jgi:hypothetical protein